MADNETTEDEPKKKSKLLIIIVIAVVVLAGGGAAAFFLLSGDSESEAPEETESAITEERVNAPLAADEAYYVKMPRAFPFNAQGVSRERIVQIDVQLLVRGATNEEIAKRHIPSIEGVLLQVFSASNADELVTDAGKQELRARSTAQVQQKMTELENATVVEEVLFTGFVIQ